MPYRYPFSDAGSDESVAGFSTETNVTLYPELLTRFLRMLDLDDTNNTCDSCGSDIDDNVHRETEYHANEPTCLEEVRQLCLTCNELEQKISTLENISEQYEQAKASADQRFQRQKELLQEAEKKIIVTKTANQELIAKLSELNNGSDATDDAIIQNSIAQLYQELEDWVQKHYNQFLVKSSSSSNNTRASSLENDFPDNILRIYGDVSKYIFSTFLAWHMVGSDGRSMDHLFSNLDREVQRTCSRKVVQYWRSATSKAALSAQAQFIESEITRLVDIVERKYGSYATTDYGARTQELLVLLNGFVQLKSQLERQKEVHQFRWYIRNMPARDDTMTSFTGECPPVGVVEYCLTPALLKLVSGSEKETILRKAMVKTYEPSLVLPK